MKVGDLVKNMLKEPGAPVGIVVELRDNIFFEDVHCNKWDYPDHVRVWYPGSNEMEINPVELYELVSKNV
tara:strand:+ start:1369 stop:1578 length:210 start_codon:yes stop_codon:yes gene_type:complete